MRNYSDMMRIKKKKKYFLTIIIIVKNKKKEILIDNKRNIKNVEILNNKCRFIRFELCVIENCID